MRNKRRLEARNNRAERATQSQIIVKEGESLVMKGPPVRVRPSALRKLAGNGREPGVDHDERTSPRQRCGRGRAAGHLRAEAGGPKVSGASGQYACGHEVARGASLRSGAVTRARAVEPACRR